MARVRNNQGYRRKIEDIFIRPYLEQENTQEREAFLQAREVIKPLQDETWKLAKTIVRRHYTKVMLRKHITCRTSLRMLIRLRKTVVFILVIKRKLIANMKKIISTKNILISD